MSTEHNGAIGNEVDQKIDKATEMIRLETDRHISENAVGFFKMLNEQNDALRRKIHDLQTALIGASVVLGLVDVYLILR